MHRITSLALCIALVWTLSAVVPAQAQTTWFVDDDGDETNGCTSWGDACPELQTALSLANPNDQIWVAVGTYKPDYDVIDGQHTGDRTATFQLITGVEIYGGFDGTETTLEDRVGLFDQTILTGDLDGNDIADLAGFFYCFSGDGIPFEPGCEVFDADMDNDIDVLDGNIDENSYHVVTGSLADNSAVIDGFVITAGSADGANPDDDGGGILNINGDPTLENCIFVHNFAHGIGHGGGMNNYNASPRILNCAFVENRGQSGGGIANFVGSNPSIVNCLFSGNVSLFGGGMINFQGSHPSVEKCTFTQNEARSGGGMYNFDSNLTVINSTFIGNSATSLFGGGGGMRNSHSSPTVTNCTFSGNSAAGNGGGMFSSDLTGDPSTPSATNCIFWSNTGGEIVDEGLSETAASYSDVLGGWPGVGNIDADPLFIDPGFWNDNGTPGVPGDDFWVEGDYHLLAGSPCIDAGNNFAVPGDVLVDLDGFARFADHLDTPDSGNGDGVLGIVDMGPYEFGGDDCNNNGILDVDDIAKGASTDCDGNNIPDECEPDCNQNGQADLCDLADGLSEDCDGTNIPDECEADCNGNGLADSCDIADGTSEDCNTNAAPDECDISDGTSEDCNGNSVPDECDVAEGTSEDCNGNTVPDECDIGDGTSEDCNGNGVPDDCINLEDDCNANQTPDACDIADGTSEDCNGNGVPDECINLEDDCNANQSPDACDIADGTSQDCGGEGIPDDCTQNPGPAISTQPASQDAETGDFVSFVVSADGVLLEYQWRKDGENLVDDGHIIGAQTSGLIIFNVEPADAGAYDCMVTDFFGDCALSNPAALTVTDPCPAETLIIKQGACPAPVNPNSNGVIPMVLVGSMSFDVNAVDPGSLSLRRCDGEGGSWAPLAEHTFVEDLNHPGDPVACGGCQCSEDQSSDGIDDLSMKFRTDATLAALGIGVGDGVVTVELSGNLLDGTPFCARDCIVVVPPGSGPINATMQSNVGDTLIEVTPLDLNIDSDGFTSFGRAYYPGTLLTVTAPPTSEGRRFVRWMIDGVLQEIGVRTIEVTVAENTTLQALYQRQRSLRPDRPTESDAPLD